MTAKRIIVLLIGVLLLAAGVLAFSSGNLINAANVTTSVPASGESIVSVQGEGIIRVVPDVAYVTLGVETSNKDVKVAQAANKDAMNAIMSELTKLGIKKEDIQTQSYNVYPDYRYENDKNVLIGYKVSNLVKVKIVNIDETGMILDAIAAKGSNIVHGVQFTVANDKKVYHDALEIALKDAEDKAKVMVGYFGITKLSPVSISEGTQNITYPLVSMERSVEDMAKATPISPGEMEICAQVSVSFKY